MSSLDAPVRRVAETLIKQFGKAATLRRITAVYSVASGDVVETKSDHAGKCVVEGFQASLVDGTTIKRGDLKVTFAASALSITPSAAGQVDPNDSSKGTRRDVLILNAVEYQVHNVEPVFSGEEVAIFVLQVRR